MKIEAYVYTAPEIWTPAPEQSFDWADGEDVDAFMRRAGYGAAETEAPNADIIEFLGVWSLHTAIAPEAPYPYALLVHTVGTCIFVLLPTAPDLLAYMRHYGGVGQLRWTQAKLDELAEGMGRFFQAWHGHSASSFCHQCDPDEYARYQQRKAEQLERKRHQAAYDRK